MIRHIITLIKTNKYGIDWSNRLIFICPQPVVIVFVCLLVFSSCQNQNSGTGSNDGAPANIPQLVYTRHARCRMDCRHITEAEIKEILMENHINNRKSNPEGQPCPSFAYEGYSNEHQHLRIVIGKCETRVWKVITCIDLGNDFECDCH